MSEARNLFHHRTTVRPATSRRCWRVQAGHLFLLAVPDYSLRSPLYLVEESQEPGDSPEGGQLPCYCSGKLLDVCPEGQPTVISDPQDLHLLLWRQRRPLKKKTNLAAFSGHHKQLCLLSSKFHLPSVPSLLNAAKDGVEA
ncbi:hypothetical protein E2C01_079541 [Portunus trituberculatus]|uniref:Uncharacterized protein n=1 Tax=Portunus trituberculatus TaxID=210409 RepID=A0A5B7IH60_PORTR|nr:hypothetical protein [Portunus trituberculatus]